MPTLFFVFVFCFSLLHSIQLSKIWDSLHCDPLSRFIFHLLFEEMANDQDNDVSGANKKTRSKPKAVWNSELHKVFVELCYSEMKVGNKPGTSLNKVGWNNVVENFVKLTGKAYDKKQMKNHWDSVKSDWKNWHYLETNATGLGWDFNKKTIDASKEWWDKHIKCCPDAAKFRDKGLEHLEELTALFKGTTAIGKEAWAPSQGILPDDTAGASHDQTNMFDSGEENFVELETQNQFHNDQPRVDSNISDENEDTEEINRIRRQRRSEEGIPPPERRQRVSAAANMNNTIEPICTAIESRNATKYTIKECMPILNQMAEVPRRSNLYLLACSLFEKKRREKRVICRI